jgi:hypothetical protein
MVIFAFDSTTDFDVRPAASIVPLEMLPLIP